MKADFHGMHAMNTLKKASTTVKTLKKALADAALVEKSVNTICFLAVDTVEKANSGLPGLSMGCAPIGNVLFDEAMRRLRILGRNSEIWLRSDHRVKLEDHVVEELR
ncbi:hypothetical protein Fmac_008143 [Flemingia macrophylla]|uniref:Transketolase N-terminal domain-containing protein n=1 Tax=Flemingia macrophylla TaxID=520843 RepID=A0ABD1MXS3_9FABA